MPTLSITVIGGSIAGCSAAIPLIRNGHDVHIFERASTTFNDRGAGIVVPAPLLEQLKALDMLDPDIPGIELQKMQYRIRSKQYPQQGRELWQRPLASVALRWGELYQQLRKRIPASYYHQNSSVAQIEQGNKKTCLILVDGRRINADLVIAADGIQSIARPMVSPASNINYADYVLWRGLIPEREIAKEFRATNLDDSVLWFPYKGGLCGSYWIPGKQPHQRLLNWGVYDAIDPATLDKLFPEIFTDAHSGVHSGAHKLDHAATNYLHTLLERKLPTRIATIIKKTQAPFLQLIADASAGQLVNQRLVLIGDAAAVLRPHTAGGAVKAIQDGLSLAQTLDKADNLDSALTDWQSEHLAELQQKATLSLALGQGWITDAPNWQTMSPAGMNRWWEQMINGVNWYLDQDPEDIKQP